MNNQTPTNNTGQSSGQSTSPNVSQSTGQAPTQTSVQNGAHSTVQNTSPNTSQTPNQTRDQSGTHNTVQNTPQNTSQSPDQSQPKQRPVDTLRSGTLKATIWQRQREDRVYYNTTFAKSYQDSYGQWHDTSSFADRDLLGVGELARQAHHRTAELRREQFKDQRETQQGQNQNQSQNRGPEPGQG